MHRSEINDSNHLIDSCNIFSICFNIWSLVIKMILCHCHYFTLSSFHNYLYKSAVILPIPYHSMKIYFLVFFLIPFTLLAQQPITNIDILRSQGYDLRFTDIGSESVRIAKEFVGRCQLLVAKACSII